MDRIRVSPDGLLRLVVKTEGTDTVIGFENHPWHTHADILAVTYGLPEADAVARFVDDIINGRTQIAISRDGNRLLDVWVTTDPESDLKYRPAGETIQFRCWDDQKSPT